MVKSPASSPVVAQMPAAFYMQSVQLPVSETIKKGIPHGFSLFSPRTLTAFQPWVDGTGGIRGLD